ncbi:MAG: PulJ/GspJ family protein [Armatimonadota bacterium]|jgi:prepilin-type N-terminal cleavage/methylation domain-containing protein
MMARSAATNRNQVARGSRGRGGFTLIEVLVVLAILIILFAMLFAPMIASLDMVNVGQAKVTMQNSARNTLTEMRREISNAMYVYPVQGVTVLGADGILGSGDLDAGEAFYPNFSQIAFVSPMFAGGSIVEPLTPRTAQNPLTGEEDLLVTVLTVELLNPAAEYSRNNPFVLVRKEGTSYQQWTNTAGDVLWWGFDPAEEIVRNVLSPRGSYDIPASRTVCAECGIVIEGYASECPGGCVGELIHVHDNVRFAPERIMGETLKANDNHTLYQTRHGAWAGFFNPGTIELNNFDGMGGLMQLGASQLDPRIVMFNPTDGSVVRDSWDNIDYSNTILTWNSNRGVVQVGATTGRWVSVTDPNAYVTPGQYYPLQVQHERPDMVATDLDQYDENGNLTTSPRHWDLVPIYPSLGVLVCTGCGSTYDPAQYNVGDPCPDPSCGGTLVSTAQPGDPVMPIAYRIDPTAAGAYQPAKVVPGNVRVVVWGTDDLGRIYQTAYSETSNPNQAEIGPEQFAVVLSDHGQRAEVRFNELRPPSPRMLTNAGINVADFGVYIQYYYRRNYDPLAPQNDYVMKVDYSTREIMNLRLALQRYIEPVDDPVNPDAKIIPSDAVIDRVSLEDQVQIRNLGR